VHTVRGVVGLFVTAFASDGMIEHELLVENLTRTPLAARQGWCVVADPSSVAAHPLV